MKNRFIYVLMGMMLIALIGIIVIQSLWIKGSIDERKRMLATNVNNALNELNDGIQEDESLFILETQFGDVDSLMNTIVFSDSIDHKKLEVKIQKDSLVLHDDHPMVIIKNEMDTETETFHSIHSLTDSMPFLHDIVVDVDSGLNHWTTSLQLKMEELDSTVSATVESFDLANGHVERISNMVEHFTFEMLLSDDLNDRIQPEVLEDKIRHHLDEAGVKSGFEYGVFDGEIFIEDFKTSNFDTTKAKTTFSKQLFQNDRMKADEYTLNIQLTESGAFIWDGVRLMTLLSVIFTILILLAFGYALRLIFKQKKISQIKNDFINNMTHELKTPLASISLASSSIRHPQVITNPEEIKKFTTMIDSERNRMQSHIDRVLEMASLDAGEIKLKFEEADLIQLIQTSIKNIELSLKEAGGALSFSPTMASLMHYVDPFHMTNVLTNILDNSIKYRRDNLEITIALTETDQAISLSITDNGIGMTKQEQELAFDKFYRSESGDLHHIKGFGLGLSYVKTIIEKHQGTVELTGAPNKGTTIKMVLQKP